MRALVSGAGGQLGSALVSVAPESAECIALSSSELDVSRAESIANAFAIHSPSVFINAAAYTAVDKAETDHVRAFEVNAGGVALLAAQCVQSKTKLVHVSTDFVFDGCSGNYIELSETSPLGVYGASKLKGEQAIINSNANAAIIRTAWVYSAHGNNFVKTMLRLMATKDELGVVADQRGTPTWAQGLAEVCWQFAQSDAQGIYHYTDDGECSWYEFACEIQRQALALGLLECEISIKPISTAEYPTPAKRPANSVLDKSRIVREQGIKLHSWQSQLGRMLRQLL